MLTLLHSLVKAFLELFARKKLILCVSIKVKINGKK